MVTPVTGQPTSDELYLIREEIILPTMLEILQKRYEAMERSSEMLKTLYLKALELLIKQVNGDRIEVRRKLRESRIKTWDGDVEDGFIIFINYNCRGFTDRFPVTREVVRSEISVRLGKYIDEAFAPLAGK